MKHVCIHAFGICPESRDLTNPDLTYVDAHDEPERVKGWTVYVRSEPDAGGEFHVLEEHDVERRETALVLSEILAAKHGTTIIQEY